MALPRKWISYHLLALIVVSVFVIVKHDDCLVAPLMLYKERDGGRPEDQVLAVTLRRRQFDHVDGRIGIFTCSARRCAVVVPIYGDTL